MFKRKKINQSYDYFSATKNSDIETNERFKEKLDFLALSRIRRESVGFYVKFMRIIDSIYSIIFMLVYWKSQSLIMSSIHIRQ